jgi:aspartyl-tRNA(Asn)/glutamyl-tRNA(Gln) amidotransferase subunit C
MQIDDKLISYLEDLSCLTLSDDDKNRLKYDLSNILSGMARLNELSTENVPERSHPFDNVNSFREDEANPSFERDLILKNAPEHNGEMFIAPKTVE